MFTAVAILDIPCFSSTFAAADRLMFTRVAGASIVMKSSVVPILHCRIDAIVTPTSQTVDCFDLLRYQAQARGASADRMLVGNRIEELASFQAEVVIPGIRRVKPSYVDGLAPF